MPDSVTQALTQLRIAERQLAHLLARASRSGHPKLYAQLTTRIRAAERQLERLERELQVA